jgi:putative methyltransferase (TIGR04325 family)
MEINEQSNVWEGVYGSFSHAAGDEDVFMGAVWLEKMADRARRLLAESVANASIAPVAVTTDYALPYVAALAAHGGPLRILDFGGGVGTSFLPLVKMLPPGLDLHFTVAENAAVCKLGREVFQNEPRIRFIEHIRDETGPYDIVHCGSSLHYVNDWVELLNRFVELEPRYMIFADLPAADNQTFVTAQLFHGRRIPVRFWNLEEFCSVVGGWGYQVLLKARYRGYYTQPGAGLPTGNFDMDHKLDYVSQLIFRSSSIDK